MAIWIRAFLSQSPHGRMSAIFSGSSIAFSHVDIRERMGKWSSSENNVNRNGRDNSISATTTYSHPQSVLRHSKRRLFVLANKIKTRGRLFANKSGEQTNRTNHSRPLVITAITKQSAYQPARQLASHWWSILVGSRQLSEWHGNSY